MRSWLSKNQLHHPLSAPVLIVAVVLAVYYPAMLGGIHTIDDPGIISLYSASPPLSQVLLPGNGYYYRPLIELSFWVDNLLWGMEPRVMHLENILLHMANVLLVLLMARKISGNYPGASPLIPLFAALLFALHPLNVEAVGWIAGRTDPLLAFFGLSACHFWLRWLDGPRRWRFMLLAGGLFLCAALTKETALALIPVAVLLTLGWPATPGSISYRQRVTTASVIALSGALLLVAAIALGGSTNSVAKFMAPGEAGVVQAAQDAATAFGFYWKKMLFPLPLNFAIDQVPALYGLLGAGVLLALLLLFKRGQLASVFFAAAALMVLPALVLAVRDISWTSVAERYMYLPTAFLALGISSAVAAQQKKVLVRVAPFLVLLLVAAAVVALQRNVLWQDKLLFYQDCVTKSPGFGSLYNELGSLLLQNNKVDEAAEAFATAERLNKRPSLRWVIKGKIMATMIAGGDYAAAKSYFFALFADKKAAPPLFLEMLQDADTKRLASLSGDEKDALSRDLIETFVLLHEKTGEPFWLYQCGKLALKLKAYPEAAGFFSTAYAEAPSDAHYRLAAQKQLLNLEKMR